MNLPPHRIALVALVLLILAGVAAWWWGAPVAIATSSRAGESVEAQAQTAIRTMPLPGVMTRIAPDQTVAAAYELCSKAMLDLMRERARQLAGQQDAKSQLAYALTSNILQEQLTVHSSPDETARLSAEQHVSSQRAFARAGKLDPTNPDIAWLAAERCVEGRACEGLQQALQEREPDNMVVWLRAMDRARNRGDDAAVEAAFRRAAEAPFYETHRGSSLLAIMEGYADMPTPEICIDLRAREIARKEFSSGRALDAGTFIEALSVAMEQAVPFSLTSLRESCKAGGATAPSTERQAGCTHIFTAMANSDTALDQYVAMSQLIELTGDTPAGIQWRERYRQLNWTMEQARQGAAHVDLLDMTTREVATNEATLRAAGRWPPPVNWLPDNERARSLIQTGRPPPAGRR